VRQVKRASMSKSGAPSEFKISETWDNCIENVLIKTSLGLIGGAVFGIVCLRPGLARSWAGGAGTGFGFGLAWNDCDAAFKKAGLTKLPTLPPRKEAPSHSAEKRPKRVINTHIFYRGDDW